MYIQDNKKSQQNSNGSPEVQYDGSTYYLTDFTENLAQCREKVKEIRAKKEAEQKRLEEKRQKRKEKRDAMKGRRKEKQREQKEKEEARAAWLEKMRKEKAERDQKQEEEGERYKAKLSLRASELAVLQEENKTLSEINENLRKQLTITKGIVFDKVTAEKAVKQWLKEYKSKADVKEVTEKVLRIVKEMRERKIPQGEQAVGETEDFVISDNTFITGQAALEMLSEEVLTQSEEVDRSAAEAYKNLLDKLKKTKIKVGKSLKEELDYYGGYNNIRKANFGRVNLSQKEGIPIDSFYLELAEMYPEFFNEEKQRTEGDMMMHILDVWEELRPTIRNPFGDNMKEAAQEAARELFTIVQDIQLAKPTFADQYESKLQKLRSEYAEYKKEMRKAAKQNQSRIEKLEKQQEKREVQKERERYRLARRETERTAKSLLSWIENPTDKYHIPQSMLSCTLSFLQKLDTANGDIAIRQQDLMGIYKEMMARQEDLKNEGFFIAVPEEFSDMITSYWNSPQKEHLEEWEQTMYISEEGMKLSEFTADQMENLKNTLKMLKRMIQDVNRLVSSERNETVSNLARGFLAEGEKKKKIRQDGKLKKAWDFFNLDMVDAPSFFKMLGKGVYDTLYAGYRHGMNKKINLLHEGISFMNETVNQKTIRKWRKEEQKTFTFTRGTGEQQKEISITLSIPQIMSLYCLNKRAAGRRHIYNGGIKADTGMLRGKKAQQQYQGVQLFPEEIGEILGTLTDEQIEAAKKVQKYFSTHVAEWGNEVTMDLFGYKKYNEHLYFPIVADKTYVNEVIGMERGDRTLKSMGMTRPTKKHAKNPLILQDIFSVYSNHIDQMSSYAAFVPVLQDTNKFVNYKELGEGQEAKNRSVKETMKGFLGDGGLKFLDKLMQQINGAAKGEDNGLAKYSRRLLRNMKTAAVGANLRVVVQQPTAIIRAANMINPMYLAMAKSGIFMTRTEYDTMYQYAPIARWKDWGYYETNVGKSVEDMVAGESISSIGAMKNRIVNASMWGAGAADKITWGQIWNACVAEAKHKHKGMTEEEIYQSAGERFTAIIDETQVVDSPLHRSQLMRDKNLLTQMATSFMAEPTKTYNLFRTAWYNCVNENTKENRMKLAKAVMVLAINGITTAVAAGFFDAFRDDDEEEENQGLLGFGKRWLRALTGDWRKAEEMSKVEKIRTFLGANIVEALNPAEYLPFARDLFSLLQGFDVHRTDMAGFADILRSGQNLMRYFEGESKYTLHAVIFDFFGSFSKLTGIPVYAVEREFTSFKNSYIGLFAGLDKQYENKKLRYNIGQEKNAGMYVKRMIEANLSGNRSLAIRIYNDMIKAGMDNETLNKKLEYHEKKMIKELPEVQKAAEAYIAADMDTLQETIDSITAKGYRESMVTKAVKSAANKLEKGEDEEELTFDSIDNSFWMAGDTDGEAGDFVNYEMLFRAYMNGSEDYGALWEGLNAIGKDDKKIKQSMRDRLSTAYAKAVVEGDYETYEKAMKEFYRLGGKSDTLENKVQKEKEKRGME